MMPKSNINVGKFLEGFAKIGVLFITAAADGHGSMDDLQVIYGSSILKRNLNVRWARDVARHDPDSLHPHRRRSDPASGSGERTRRRVVELEAYAPSARVSG